MFITQAGIVKEGKKITNYLLKVKDNDEGEESEGKESRVHMR